MLVGLGYEIDVISINYCSSIKYTITWFHPIYIHLLPPTVEQQSLYNLRSADNINQITAVKEIFFLSINNKLDNSMPLLSRYEVLFLCKLLLL